MEHVVGSSKEAHSDSLSLLKVKCIILADDFICFIFYSNCFGVLKSKGWMNRSAFVNAVEIDLAVIINVLTVNLIKELVSIA